MQTQFVQIFDLFVLQLTRAHTFLCCLVPPLRSPMWRDCADVYKAGHSISGLYHIYISNRTEPVQVQWTLDTLRL